MTIRKSLKTSKPYWIEDSGDSNKATDRYFSIHFSPNSQTIKHPSTLWDTASINHCGLSKQSIYIIGKCKSPRARNSFSTWKLLNILLAYYSYVSGVLGKYWRNICCALPCFPNEMENRVWRLSFLPTYSWKKIIRFSTNSLSNLSCDRLFKCTIQTGCNKMLSIILPNM